MRARHRCPRAVTWCGELARRTRSSCRAANARPKTESRGVHHPQACDGRPQLEPCRLPTEYLVITSPAPVRESLTPQPAVLPSSATICDKHGRWLRSCVHRIHRAVECRGDTHDSRSTKCVVAYFLAPGSRWHAIESRHAAGARGVHRGGLDTSRAYNDGTYSTVVRANTCGATLGSCRGMALARTAARSSINAHVRLRHRRVHGFTLRWPICHSRNVFARHSCLRPRPGPRFPFVTSAHAPCSTMRAPRPGGLLHDSGPSKMTQLLYAAEFCCRRGCGEHASQLSRLRHAVSSRGQVRNSGRDPEPGPYMCALNDFDCY